MAEYGKYGWALGAIAIVIAAIALAMALRAPGGGDTNAMSGVMTGLSVQSAEVESLSSQISSLQTELTDSRQMEASNVAELTEQLEGLRGQSMQADEFDDSELKSAISDIRATLAELDSRMDTDGEDDDRIDSEHIEGLGAELSSLSASLAELHDAMSDGGGTIEMAIAELDAVRAELMQLQDAVSSDISSGIDDALARLNWLEKAAAPAYTKTYVEQAINRYDANGRAATLDYYSAMESVNGDLYLFVLDENYEVIVNPTLPNNIGMDIRGSLGTDITGKNFGAEFVTVDETGKWIDYVYLNPADDFNYERKHVWIVRHDNLIFGSGWYEREVSLESTPSAYARALVEQAVARYDAEGRDATLVRYNDPTSVAGQYYVLIIDSSDLRAVANGARPDLVGTIPDRIDPTGYYYGSDIASATEEGKWISYVILNPETGEEQRKHTWITLHDGLVFGSGYYEPTVASMQSSDEEENVLTILYWQAPSLPGPYLVAGNKDTDAGAVTLEPLASYDPDGELTPRLTAEIPTLENGGISEDLMSITWKLRQGLKWSDSSDFTANDVVFTWRYCTDEETGCIGEDAFSGIESVNAIDDLTVRIEFDAPVPYPYTAFVGAGTPIISSAQFAECVGVAARTCEQQNTAPLGTGPYRITEFTPNEGAVYERNPFYWGETPYFDRVVIKGGGDAITAARSVLEADEADYAWNLQVDPNTLAEMEAAGQGTVVSAFSSLVERIVINHTNPDPALGDDRSEYLDGTNPHPFLTFTPITQAMSMAIDRTQISEPLYGFAGKPACNIIIAPSRYASTANDGCLTQDIEGANSLLDDNGVLDTDGDGIREYNGVPLRIAYQTTSNAIRQDTQALIRDWWRQIGIETELIQHDASVFFGGDPIVDKEASYRRFFSDVQMYTTGSGVDPQQYLSGQRCSHIQTRDNNWADGNNARACSAEFDEVFEKLEQTTAGSERDALVK